MVKIAIGTAAVGRVSVNASPATVPNSGGSTTVSASVFDINGNVLASVPVSFTTTAGILSTGVATTGTNGVASTILTTSQVSTVTASVGATLRCRGTIGRNDRRDDGGHHDRIGPDVWPGDRRQRGIGADTRHHPADDSPSVGLPALFSFTFAVTAAATNGSAVRDLSVNWGDGSFGDTNPVTDLGAVDGSAIASVSHVHCKPDDLWLVSATVTDATGNSNTVSTPVTVVPVPRPGIIVTQSPNPGAVGTETTLTIQVTVATGIFVQSLSIDFGDGTSANLGGASSAVVEHTYTAVRTYNVIVTVLDSSGQTTVGTAVISIAAT